MNEIYRNAEYYADPTAGEAIQRAEREKRAEQRKKAERRKTGGIISPLQENWEDFADAIIIQAAEDYREARKELKSRPGREGPLEVIREVERFFRSRWFARLTDADGERLLDRLREET